MVDGRPQIDRSRARFTANPMTRLTRFLAGRQLEGVPVVVECIPVTFDFSEVVGGPGAQDQEGLLERATQRRDLVLHSNRALIQYPALDEAVAFQPSQRLREGLLGDPVELSLELVEAARLLTQRGQQQLTPLVEQLIQELALRTDDGLVTGPIVGDTRFR